MGNESDILDLLTNTADGVFAVDAEGRIVLWSPSAERILGYTSREVLGKPCCAVMAGRDEFNNTICYQGCHVSTMVKRGEPVNSYDMLTKDKKGREVWINVSTLPIPSARRGGTIIAHFFRDVTARHQIERLVRESTSSAPATASPLSNSMLTQREREILTLIASGSGSKAIADQLHISTATVRNHSQNILEKLGVHSRLEAVAYAIQHGYLNGHSRL